MAEAIFLIIGEAVVSCITAPICKPNRFATATHNTMEQQQEEQDKKQDKIRPSSKFCNCNRVTKCCYVLGCIIIGLLPAAYYTYYYYIVYGSLNFSFVQLKAKCNGQVCKETAKEILISLNQSIDPCDNFYDFACQGWANKNPRPDYRSLWDPLNKMELESWDLAIGILNQPKNSSTDIPALIQAKDYFRKCMDIEKIQDEPDQERKTMQLILDTLEEYGGWPVLYNEGQWNSSRFSIVKSIAALRRLFGYIDILDVHIYQSDFRNLGKKSIALFRPTSSSDATSTVDTDPTESNPYLMTLSFIANVTRQLLQFKGETNINETRLYEQVADLRLVSVRLRSVDKMANKKLTFGFSDNQAVMTLNVLQNMLDKHQITSVDEMNLPELLRLSFLDTGISINPLEDVIVDDLDYFLGVSMYLSETKKEIIANYLHYHMVFQMLLLLPSQKFRSYGNTLKYSQDGATQPLPRNFICIDATLKRFSFVLDHKYVLHKYGNLPTSKVNEDLEQVEQLFNNTKSSFSKLVSSSTKFDLLTRRRLVITLYDTGFCPGYPSWIYEDDKVQAEYADLILTGSSYFEQSMALNKWVNAKKLRQLHEPTDGDVCKWPEFIGSVGPYFKTRRVYVPISIVTAPFFDLDLPKSIIYGKLGSILGHELTHGLIADDDGWTESNGNKTELAKCLINYYNNFTFDELRNKNITLDGDYTLKENLPDNAGLLAAYQAYKRDVENAPSVRIEGLEKYTDDQLFYIGFAQNWCDSTTLQEKRYSLSGEVHSAGRFRVLGSLQNSKEFAQAWNCPVGSKMNPGPNKTPNTCTIF